MVTEEKSCDILTKDDNQMNEFYSIGEENQNSVDEFQLENLGERTIMAIVGTPVRGDWGERSYQSKRFYKETKAEDYDKLFVSKLVRCRPPYLE